MESRVASFGHWMALSRSDWYTMFKDSANTGSYDRLSTLYRFAILEKQRAERSRATSKKKLCADASCLVPTAPCSCCLYAGDTLLKIAANSFRENEVSF